MSSDGLTDDAADLAKIKDAAEFMQKIADETRQWTQRSVVAVERQAAALERIAVCLERYFGNGGAR